LDCIKRSSTHGAPRAQPFVKVGGGTCPTVPNGTGATGVSTWCDFPLWVTREMGIPWDHGLHLWE